MPASKVLHFLQTYLIILQSLDIEKPREFYGQCIPLFFAIFHKQKRLFRHHFFQVRLFKFLPCIFCLVLIKLRRKI